ncbi:16S rRNA (adenine(1518)-N(6)/adenine(1519)-N(6))-dimethyltransferase RsmA [Marinimicrococcus flavescens]|uniref:Ribosomal RNA small subunit methyltransferase A n=1 Tax=Marinimicrococcus flavescens TaxID=3031815 RepID=A0AAP3UY37_9PROT|nr:16S rRNA (adenine(1518)-N(6)/adenine(1519)-N(6))-dimethyltransferase RsmA [Marinimicrococcus flavescens]
MTTTPPPSPLAPLREVIRRHGLQADKRLGQHFLTDPSILARIARAAGPLEGCTVLEVGPGPGGLTRAILEAGAARVIAVERDARCIAALEELVAWSGGRLEIVEADARRFDPAGLAPEGQLRLVANLPYNVGTELLLGWYRRLELFHSLTLMFQREVVLRLVAQQGGDDYGRLAVMTRRLCCAERVFDLSPASFVPPPKVHSSLVRLVPRPDLPTAAERRLLERVTQAAFGQRRKMLRSSLKSLGVPPEPLLERAGIDPQRRAETLSLDEFEALARALGTNAAQGS